MSDEVQIIMHAGAFGASEFDDALDTALREIALRASTGPEWAEKYGTAFENDEFMMHPFCWCELEDCPWCAGTEPNFRHKPSGFEVTWYKYIGRSVEHEGTPPPDLLERCLASIPAPVQEQRGEQEP